MTKEPIKTLPGFPVSATAVLFSMDFDPANSYFQFRALSYVNWINPTQFFTISIYNDLHFYATSNSSISGFQDTNIGKCLVRKWNTAFPIESFTIIEPRNMSIDVSELHQIFFRNSEIVECWIVYWIRIKPDRTGFNLRAFDMVLKRRSTDFFLIHLSFILLYFQALPCKLPWAISSLT